MPVHYDIEAAEKEAREALAKANASLDASVAAGRAKAGFAAAQKAFSEAPLQLYLAGLRAENLGVDALTVAHAMGLAVRSMLTAAGDTYGSNPVLLHAFLSGMNRPDDPEHGHSAEVSVRPMQSGRA